VPLVGTVGHVRLSLPALLVAGSIAAFLPVTAAQAAKKHRARPCSFSVGPVSAGPTVESGALDPEITATYAILRRAPGPEDQLPPINPLGEDVQYQLRSYFPGYIRQVAVDPDGDRYFMVVGFEHGFGVPPARCLPPKLRRHRAQLVAEQHARERRLVYCIEDVGPHRPRYPEAGCQPFAAIPTGENLTATASSRNEVTLLVPDGVATVRLLYRSRAVITAPVNNNAYSFTPPQRPIKRAMKRLRRLLQALNKGHLTSRQRSRALRELSKRSGHIFAQLPPRRVEWLGANGELVRGFQPRAQGLTIFGF
jgi:hypothetical protein